MSIVNTIINGTRVFFGIILGYEQRLDRYTQLYKEYTEFVEQNCVFIDDYGRKLPYASQDDIQSKLSKYKELRYKLDRVLKIAR